MLLSTFYDVQRNNKHASDRMSVKEIEADIMKPCGVITRTQSLIETCEAGMITNLYRIEEEDIGACHICGAVSDEQTQLTLSPTDIELRLCPLCTLAVIERNLDTGALDDKG